MHTTNIADAKTQLSDLIEEVQNGQEVIIEKAGKPVARLVSIETPFHPADLTGKNKPDIAGKHLPRDIANAFGMID